MLEALDLGRTLTKARYKKRMPRLQRRLHRLQRACWEAKVATVAVFEGWDAAGKGTAIRKLTQRLEPRGFSLHAIHAPRTFESHLPWMWRFWVKIPHWGEMALFDRSWYGRVLVERVEGLTDESSWRAAYNDIVSFERALADDRYQIVKFFLHIWRFWRRLAAPDEKQILIFDRSWYGRVLVERVEGFATDEEWRRAYREINEFERQLTDHGMLVVKFWFHISKEEQLRRFEARRKTPHKAWKLTDEDWRNRGQWDAYERAVEEMVLKTSTSNAPWTLVEGNDKLWARIRTLETLIERLDPALEATS